MSSNNSKIAALITASGGIGSHLVLHKLQGHPDLCALYEGSFRSQGGTTKSDLKRFLSQNIFPHAVGNEQLKPKKNAIEAACLVLNKPPLKMINYHRNFHPELPILYMFRNPVSFYFTWIKKWKENGAKRYNRTISDEKVFEWFKVTFMSSLFELAQCYDPKRDVIVSFEHFFNDIDSELERIFKCLNVSVMKDEDLEVFNKCRTCGTDKVVRKEMRVRGERVEEVLYCHRHGPSLGPGEYNYIRKEDPSFLNKWKDNPLCEEASEKFSKLFGEDLIEYYLKEEYLEDLSRLKFDSLIHEFLGKLKIEI